MEGIKEIASAFYERASEDEKKEAKEFFKKVDRNGDGKVTLLELKKASLGSMISNENIFKQLDQNGERSLGFHDVLVYYMVNKVGITFCRGCSWLLVGPYFSCLLCLGKGPNTFDLCCDCHRAGLIPHEHSSEYMLDHHSLLSEMRKRTTEAENSRGPQRKREMEELREIARAHMEASSPEVQAKAYKFFKSMDTDGDERVDLSEFLYFMRHEGYLHMDNHFFKDLDLDSNGTLDFWEVMTLYYVIISGRPFCNSCRNFIPGTFFSCVGCFKNRKASFNLCRDCYLSTKCKNNHGCRAQFLDNYTLLEALITQTARSSSDQHRSTASSSIPDHRKEALKALEMALKIGDISSNIANTASNVADTASNIADVASNIADGTSNVADVASNIADIASNVASVAAFCTIM